MNEHVLERRRDRAGRSWPAPRRAGALRSGTAPSSSPSRQRRSRTCARSPNSCTSSTPGIAASAVDGRTRSGRLDLDQRARQRRLQPGWFVERHDPSLVQQRNPRAALRLVQVRRGHHDRQAARQELGEQLPELTTRHRIDAGRRLVEQQDVGPMDERAGERQFLLHAARQSIGPAGSERRQLGQGQQPIPLRRIIAGRRGFLLETRCSRRSTDRRRVRTAARDTRPSR